MMKKLIFSACFTLLMAGFANAQPTIAVLTGNDWSFYTDFPTALNEAESGSTIYLPGGVFQISSNSPDATNTINKQLNIIGVGHYPDSTIATNKTVLAGSIYFANGSDNSIIEGVEVTEQIRSMPDVGQNNIVNNIIIKRCKVSHNSAGSNNSFAIIIIEHASSYLNNLLITESIVNGLRADNNYIINLGLTVLNSIVHGTFRAHYGAIFKNNIFFAIINGSGSPVHFSHCIFENNIFIKSYLSNSPNSIYRNNLFLTSSNPSCSNCMEFSNNLIANLSSTFVNAPNSALDVVTPIFSYAYDFNLLPSSIAKNAGTDGTDIGIYGTAYPCKPSAVPANPHISTKSISPSSAPNGTLPVNIRVIAQDR